jgi:hypothetical protein
MIHPAKGQRSGIDSKANGASGRFDADGVVPRVSEVTA